MLKKLKENQSKSNDCSSLNKIFFYAETTFIQSWTKNLNLGLTISKNDCSEKLLLFVFSDCPTTVPSWRGL